jgi:hypothetical protein
MTAAATRATAVGAAATMTEPTSPPEAPAARRREPIRKPGAFPVIAASLGLFLAITALLAFQMRAGADPALGKGEPQVQAAATPAAPRRVLIRRVIVTRIVEHRRRRDDGAPAPGAAAAPATASAPAPSAPSAPAPAPAAPAPAPAAPAPAPLITRSS